MCCWIKHIYPLIGQFSFIYSLTTDTVYKYDILLRIPSVFASKTEVRHSLSVLLSSLLTVTSLASLIRLAYIISLVFASKTEPRVSYQNVTRPTSEGREMILINAFAECLGDMLRDRILNGVDALLGIRESERPK